MDLTVGDAPGVVIERAGLLARGFSEGRRGGCRIGGRRTATCWTDLYTVLLTWPMPSFVLSDPHGLSGCIALQASPTKEAVSTLSSGDFGLRELAALQLSEGAAALGWISERWPGLAGPLASLTGSLDPAPWQDVGGEELAERARRLSAGSRSLLPVPAVLGAIPLQPSTASAARRLAGLAARVRFLGDGLERIGDRLAEPIAVAGAWETDGPSERRPLPDEETVLRAGDGAGIPFPEWDVNAQSYRPDFTRVVEYRGARRTPRAPAYAPRLEDWLSLSQERRWCGRQADGSDIDIDGVVDALVDDAAGQPPEDRLYRERVRVERDVACAVLLDSSGSLAQAELLEHELACADALVGSMSRSGEQCGVFAFWSHGRDRVMLDVVRDFAETAVRPGVAALRPTHHTRLGAAIRAVTARLTAEQATRRILLVLTDGVPFDDGYEGHYAYADVTKALEEAEDHEVSVAILCCAPQPSPSLAEHIGARLSQVSTFDELAPALGRIHARLVR